MEWGGSSCGATAREVTHYLRDARLGGSREKASAWPSREQDALGPHNYI